MTSKTNNNAHHHQVAVLSPTKIAGTTTAATAPPPEPQGGPVVAGSTNVYPYEVLSHRMRRLLATLQRLVQKANQEMDVVGARRTRVSTDDDDSQLRLWGLINHLAETVQYAQYVDSMLEGYTTSRGPEIARLRAQMTQTVGAADRAHSMLFHKVCTGKSH